MAFADNLGAVATFLNMPDGASTTTIESKTNFLRPIPIGTTATAICTPVHKGRKTMVWRTNIFVSAQHLFYRACGLVDTEQGRRHRRTDFLVCIEKPTVRFVLDELDRTQHAFAKDLAHECVEIGAGRAGVFDQPQPIDEVGIGDARGRADGVRRIGPAVADTMSGSML